MKNIMIGFLLANIYSQCLGDTNEDGDINITENE